MIFSLNDKMWDELQHHYWHMSKDIVFQVQATYCMIDSTKSQTCRFIQRHNSTVIPTVKPALKTTPI